MKTENIKSGAIVLLLGACVLMIVKLNGAPTPERRPTVRYTPVVARGALYLVDGDTGRVKEVVTENGDKNDLGTTFVEMTGYVSVARVKPRE